MFSQIFRMNHVRTDGHTIGIVFDLLRCGLYTVGTGNEVVDSILGKAGGMDGTVGTVSPVFLTVASGGAQG